ncbi:hypothetical protein [Dietzia sp. 111N12-1]|uniref:hypothetical protein n=1 Tax=Dietzia sp. 111N12-1 TaxID=1785156 RepID=UPI00352E26C9
MTENDTDLEQMGSPSALEELQPAALLDEKANLEQLQTATAPEEKADLEELRSAPLADEKNVTELDGVNSAIQNEPDDDGVSPSGDTEETEPETFPAKVVKDLRKENARYRERAQKADQLAQRLHTALVGQTGKLADPTDLEFDEAHLEDPDALAAAVDDLLTRKPHLRARRVAGDVGQGNRGKTGGGPDLLEAMRGTL